jgi:hypothetical protein
MSALGPHFVEGLWDLPPEELRRFAFKIATASMRPRSHDDVFENLDRCVKTPNAAPFQAAGGWVNGFQANPQAARACLSKAWSR